jgi:LPS export ABC transporter protein LptC
MSWLAPFVGLLLVAGFRPEVLAAVPPSRSVAAPAEITLRQIHMVETRAGSKLWELRADRAEVDERAGSTVLSRGKRPVQVTLYSSQGLLTCTADRVTVDLTTKDVRLEGAVFARSEQGTELRTEMVRWIAASRRLQTDRPVTVTRGNLSSRGRGMEAETDLERVRIFQNITSQLGGPAPAPSSTPRGKGALP